MELQRLDRLLSKQTGMSRSEVKTLIKEGRVKINGEACLESDKKIHGEQDKIEVCGKILNFKRHIYLMMNKPAGVLSASRDKNAKTVLDLVPEEYMRKGLFPAGRLDKDTEGLLIITDDGDFAHRMLSPNKKVYKLYEARLDKPLTKEAADVFARGIVFRDGTSCLPARAWRKNDASPDVACVEICEGKFHQVKKMFAACGFSVLFLERKSIGGLVLDGKLHKGDCRELTENERKSIFIGNLT